MQDMQNMQFFDNIQKCKICKMFKRYNICKICNSEPVFWIVSLTAFCNHSGKVLIAIQAKLGQTLTNGPPFRLWCKTSILSTVPL